MRPAVRRVRQRMRNEARRRPGWWLMPTNFAPGSGVNNTTLCPAPVVAALALTLSPMRPAMSQSSRRPNNFGIARATLRGVVCFALALGCAPHAPRVDVASETSRLLERDRAWAAAASAGKDVDGVLAFWTDDAR